MTKQAIHRRVSKKGKPFLAGKGAQKKPIKSDAANLAPKNSLFVIGNMAIFKRLVKVLNSYLQQAKIVFNGGTAYILEMDPANVAMIKYRLHNQLGIVVKNTGNKAIGINIKIFYDAIKDFDNGEVANIFLNNDKTRLIIKNKEVKKELLLLDIADWGEGQKIPELDKLKIDYLVTGDKFLKAIKEVAKDSESIRFIAGPDGFTVSSANNERDNTRFLVNPGEPTTGAYETPLKEIVRAKYSHEYLLKLAPILTSQTDVHVSWADDYPLRLKISKVGGDVTFILAPRVDND